MSANLEREILRPAYFFSVLADCAATRCLNLLAGKGANSSLSPDFSVNLAAVTRKIRNDPHSCIKKINKLLGLYSISEPCSTERALATPQF